MNRLKSCIEDVGYVKDYSGIALVCIGTDRSTGDSFGALVGSIAKERKLDEDYDIIVIGDLEHPIHAVNMNDYMEEIECLSENYVIIAVDAAVTSDGGNIGNLVVKNCGINPGLGVGKSLPSIGDICICYNVIGCGMEQCLNSVRLGEVFKMANKAVDMIQEYLEDGKANLPIRAEVMIDKTGSIILREDTYLIPDVAFAIEVIRSLMVKGEKIKSRDFAADSILSAAYETIYGKYDDIDYIRRRFRRSLYRLVGVNIRISDVTEQLNSGINFDRLFRSDVYRLHREKILYILNNPENIYWEGSNYRVRKGRHKECGVETTRLVRLKMAQAE